MKEYYKTPTTISAISAVILIGLIFDGQLRIGYGISKIFPCETPEFNSFPCYGLYSIYLFIFLFIVFTLSVGYTIELYQTRNGKQTKKIIFSLLRAFWNGILLGATIIAIWIVIAQILIFFHVM